MNRRNLTTFFYFKTKIFCFGTKTSKWKISLVVSKSLWFLNHFFFQKLKNNSFVNYTIAKPSFNSHQHYPTHSITPSTFRLYAFMLKAYNEPKFQTSSQIISSQKVTLGLHRVWIITKQPCGKAFYKTWTKTLRLAQPKVNAITVRTEQVKVPKLVWRNLICDLVRLNEVNLPHYRNYFRGLIPFICSIQGFTERDT